MKYTEIWAKEGDLDDRGTELPVCEVSEGKNEREQGEVGEKRW